MRFLYAILSSALFGVNYLLFEKILEKMPVSVFIFFNFLASTVIAGLFVLLSKNKFSEIKIVKDDPKLLFFVIANVIVVFLYNILIGFAVNLKNAALVSLIEMTYPIFIIIFGYILFKELNLSLPIIIGGILIFSGVAVLYIYNR